MTVRHADRQLALIAALLAAANLVLRLITGRGGL